MERENETTQSEDVLRWIGSWIEHFEKRKITKTEIYITSECLEKLNQIFYVNSMTEFQEYKTIMGLTIIEITPITKLTWKEVEEIQDNEISITSVVGVMNMRYKRPRMRKW